MKQLVLLVAWVVGCLSLQAQEKIRPSAVPPNVMEEFESRFADAQDVVWLREGEQFYGARFVVLGQSTEAIYTPSGEWVQTEQEITYRDMPDSARAYCRSNYPDYQAKAVKKVSTRRYGILYEIKILGGMKQIGMTFDMHGKLVSKKETEAVDESSQPASTKEKLSRLLKKPSE